MLRRILVFWIAWLSVVVIGYALAMQPANAADWLELQHLDITYRSYFPGGIDPLLTQNPTLPGRTLGKELNLTVDTYFFDFIYWNSTVHSMTDAVLNSDGTTDGGQFRMVGLETGLGIDFHKIYGEFPVSIGYYHWSTHVLDAEDGLGPFPRRDAIELRVRLYDRSYR